MASAIELAAAIISAVLGIGMLVFAGGRFTENVKANTRVTEKLGEVIDRHLIWSAQIVREHDERFHEHEIRLTAQDAKIEALEARKR